MKKLFCVLALCLLSASVFAQSEETVVVAEEIDVDIPVSDFSAMNDTEYSAEEIRAVMPLDFTDIFTSNGFFTHDNGAYGLQTSPSIRGFTGASVRVIMNGVCVNNPQLGTFDFTSISPYSFSSVSLVKGGFSDSTRDMDAVGGTIYLSTAAPIDGKRSLFFDNFALTYFNKDHVVDTYGSSSVLSFPLPYSKLTFSSKFTQAENAHWYKTGDEWKTRENSSVQDESLSLDWHFCKDDFDSDTFVQFYYGDKNTPGSISFPSHGKQIDLNLRAVEDFSWKIGSFLISGTTSYNLGRQKYDTGVLSVHLLNEFSQYLSGKWSSENLSEEVGLTFKVSCIDSTDSGSHIQFPLSASSLTKWMITPSQGLSVNLGVKYSHPNFAFIPKLGYELTFADTGSLYANIYTMDRFPTINDLYWPEDAYSCGNPDLKPEHGYGFEVGYKSSDDFIVPFSATLYSNYYEDMIDWAPRTEDYKYVPSNVDAVLYLGGELSVSKYLFDNALLIKGGYSFTWTSQIEDGKITNKQLSYKPMHSGSVSLTYSTNLIDSTLSLSCMGKRPVDDANTTYLDPYFLLDISLAYNGFDMLTPYIVAKNLLNATYETVAGYPSESPSLRLGVKISLD